MSKLTRWTIGIVGPLCFIAVAMVHAEVGETTISSSGLKTYRDVDGQTYFALNLRPTMKETVNKHRDIVVLVDTSASQTGLFREDALEAVDTIVGGLRAEERIKVMAIDLRAVPMTAGFVKGGSKELAAGIAKLKARTPLGATDLLSGINSAIQAFEQNTHARSVIYIGDGMSRANLPALDELEPMAQKLVDSRVSVSSYAVGLQRDIELLAVLANNSGGSVYLDGPTITAQQAGVASLELARGTVVWPTKVEWSSSVTQAYPVRVPPLRFDRDSILVGTMVGKDKLQLSIEADVDGRPTTLDYALAPVDTTEIDDFAMVPELVAMARQTDGIAMPLLGSESLDQARRTFRASSETLSKLGKQALASGDQEGGVELLREALRRDPGNTQAHALLKLNTKVRPTSTKGIVAQFDEEELAPTPDLDANPTTVLPDVPTQVPADLVVESTAQPLVLSGGASDADLLLNAEQARELEEAIMRAEVAQALSTARDTMQADPAGTLEDLKNLQETLKQSPGISSGVRAELLDRLDVGLRQASRRRIEKDRLDEVARANVAELEARRRLLDAATHQNEVVQDFLAQVNALLDEGRFELAEEVALEMRDKAPQMVAPTVAVTEAGHLGNYSRMRELHALNARRLNDALYQVELSHIPFPDDPPIVYPDASIWGPLSERRKAQALVDLGETGPAERRITAALQSPAALEFQDETLANVMAVLEEDHQIPIEFDNSALTDENVDTSDTVSIDVSNITLRSALRLLLRDLNLTYVIENEVLMITSKDKAEETLVTKVYPVGDLVMPINSMMMMGGGMMGGMMGGMGGGMMGGMGGGMMGGGMGGGMMGGGMMGGMGGGMMGGGMGGGMMGGGMGGGMFAVEDVISLGNAKPAKRTETPIVPTRIEVTRESGETADAAWDRYFSTEWNKDVTVEEERQHFANVRETVRELSKEKKFTEIVALIQSALRNGHFQPWMHILLGQALRATGAEDDTIERAFMSTVDLTQNPDEMVLVAAQLSGLGLDARAMQLYRDIATAFPLRPEPYMHALAAAKRIQDSEGIRWACENILAQAWPEKHKYVFDKAVRTAKATLYDLEKAGKKQEAKELADALNVALSRDCVVRVTWTGDADVDLYVEEPTGTVCSFSNKRTNSGGVMLGDELPDPSAQTEDGLSETYVCPKGFSGEYRVLVRRITGEVATGKVTVEIATNVRTDEQTTTAKQHIRQQIDLREKDAVLTFKLEDGRREEQIEDHIVANAAVRHIEANQVALAQFDRLADERVAASNSLAELAALTTRDPRQGLRLQAALRGRGAVGFMPQLTVLPEGTSMMGNAVISADRRYVRVSMSPFFSRVADVQTFNFATGQGGQQGGAGGGLGGAGGGGGFGGGGFGGGGFGGGGGGLGGGLGGGGGF